MSNALGLLGFVLILVAVGLLAGWRWSLLGAGFVLLLAAYAAHTAEVATARAAEAAKPKGDD